MMFGLALCAVPGRPQGTIFPQSRFRRPLIGSELTELPVGLAGPYGRTHIGPCFLADRVRGQLFSFPLVIAQRRTETVLRPVKMPDGKMRVRPQRVAIDRRAFGLSPVQAADDDLPRDEARSALNRRARIVEANAASAYWSAQVNFAPATLPRSVTPLSGSADKSADVWGAGEATVSYFPANVAPDNDGILIRISLANRSSAPQTYVVDLLGGMESVSQAFLPSDLSVLPDAHTDTMIVRHAKADAVFALMGNTASFSQRAYRVNEDYLAPEAAINPVGATGVALPAGVERVPETPPAQPDNKEKGEGGNGNKVLRGLLRVDEIRVAPGETVALTLCVGIGTSEETAVESGSALLAQAEDILPNGMRRKGDGLITKAQSAHQTVRSQIGNSALERLMAQSFVNIPFEDLRRVGVPSRQETRGVFGSVYQPASGGLIALGWTADHPAWAAAQLNAYFVTQGKPDAPIREPKAVPPTNLFALWELYQRRHERATLVRFYPFARRRYQELLAAGRTLNSEWLFAWPAGDDDLSTIARTDPAAGGPKRDLKERPAPRIYAPDYSAYVIRSARILRQMAEELDRKDDARDYTRDIEETTRALNANLWDAQRGAYVPKPLMEGMPMGAPDALNSLLPLIAGSEAVTPAQSALLFKQLTDPAAFWSDFGLRSLSKASSLYRPERPRRGAISFGDTWMLWKALLDLGQSEKARVLADNLSRAYAGAQKATESCPEWLHGETGAAGGALDYSGDAGALIPLYHAYHTPGTVSAGWEVTLLGPRYDRLADTLHLPFRVTNPSGQATLLCVMGKPNAKYRITGSRMDTVTTDANGVLTLTAPRETTTQSLEITPQ